MKIHYVYTLFAVTLAFSVTLALTACKGRAGNDAEAAAADAPALTPVKFNADSAMTYLRAQCDFGARVPGSTAHTRCGDYIASKFRALGLQVTEQRTEMKAWDGKVLAVRNIIASYRPDAEERVVLAAHWDSRPWADADPDSSKHHDPVMAANDGAAGVAALLEVARQIKVLKPAVGIDFVCFDAEDYGAPYWGKADPDGKDWCMGSRYWAEQAAATGYKARYGILLDMIAGQDAAFRFEGFSKQKAEAVQARIWDTAARVGAGSLFVKEDGGYATDDHVNMNDLAGIPTVDIIPFIPGAEQTFGATWHTTHDTPDNISPENLRLVGQMLLQLLSEEM